MKNIPGGHTVSVKLDPLLYDNKVVDVELKVSGNATHVLSILQSFIAG